MKQTTKIVSTQREIKLLQDAIDALLILEGRRSFPNGLPLDICKALAVLRREETILNDYLDNLSN